MIESLADIPLTIRRSASELIREQAAVPVSPLSRTPSGGIELCVAAALAFAATDPGRDRDVLVDQLERDGRDHIMNAFEELGWSKDLGKRMLVANDSFDAATRKSDVLTLLALN